jgi:hypothetical protein
MEPACRIDDDNIELARADGADARARSRRHQGTPLSRSTLPSVMTYPSRDADATPTHVLRMAQRLRRPTLTRRRSPGGSASGRVPSAVSRRSAARARGAGDPAPESRALGSSRGRTRSSQFGSHQFQWPSRLIVAGSASEEQPLLTSPRLGGAQDADAHGARIGDSCASYGRVGRGFCRGVLAASSAVPAPDVT